MNSSSSAKPTMSPNRRSVSFLVRPINEAFRYTFSRPVSSLWKPAPRASREAIRPRVVMAPAVGRRIPAISLSSVVFPEPFGPSRPSVWPSGTSTDTPLSAHNSSDRTLIRTTRSLIEVGRSR